MPKFIQVLDTNDWAVEINIDQIASINSPPKDYPEEFTVIHLANGEKVTTKAPAETILRLIPDSRFGR